MFGKTVGPLTIVHFSDNTVFSSRDWLFKLQTIILYYTVKCLIFTALPDSFA